MCMNVLLSALAALVPILGALYVSVRVLLTQKKLSNELQVRREAAASYQRSASAAVKQLDSEGIRFARVVEEQTLLKHGLAPKPASDAQAELATAGRLLSKSERTDQWVLIGSSSAGVILLALGFVCG